MMDAERIAELRFRLERRDGLCLNEHTVNKHPSEAEMWITCGGETIDRVVFPITASQDDLRAWMTLTMERHRARVAERIVGELLDGLEK